MISSQKVSDNCSFSYTQKNGRVRYKTSRRERTPTRVFRCQEGNKRGLTIRCGQESSITADTLLASSRSVDPQYGDDSLAHSLVQRLHTATAHIRTLVTRSSTHSVTTHSRRSVTRHVARTHAAEQVPVFEPVDVRDRAVGFSRLRSGTLARRPAQ